MNILLPFLVFFPMAGGITSYLIGRKSKTARDFFACLVTAVTLFASLSIYGKEMTFVWKEFCGLGILFRADSLQVLLCILTAFVWLFTTIFSKDYFKNYRNRNRYYIFMQATLGAVNGVFLSGDLYTTFIFFEIMSFTSFVLVIHDESSLAKNAAHSYLTIAVFGGLVMLMGIFLLYSKTGTLDITQLGEIIAKAKDKTYYYWSGVLMLCGFGAKAGSFPLHTWLPEAHPAAPAPASALLSCIMLKTGIFGILVISSVMFLHDALWGRLILLLGVITMVLGAVLAVFSINLKRTLACSSMSQIGFILTGVGMQGILGSHNALAADGTLLHIVNHILLKLVLFMSAGVVYMNLHELNLNKIRGFGRDKPLLKFIFLMGVLGITGVPLWNGYISKTLLHESIVEQIVLMRASGQSPLFFQGVEFLFLFSGGLTVAYMTKLFVALFVDHVPKKLEHCDSGSYMGRASAVVLAISAGILPILGMIPHQTMDLIADMGRHFVSSHAPAHTVHYFAWVNLKGAGISLAIGAIVYFGFIQTVLMKRGKNEEMIYVDGWPGILNLERYIYQPVLMVILPFIGALFSRFFSSLVDWVISFFRVHVFNNDHGKVIPQEDAYFSLYTHEAGAGSEFREGLAKSLLLFGLGVTVAMLYMLF